ncbi:MAG: DUF4422 domain-containing protein [Butyrivibrio sp.]|uniref:DUF4422 domain-containing protein n=1 Tax=Butyrivibrio sp. TaxID=28121 RepID=UPI0025C6C1E9|nr:DUF4422 domain-containing protein [Butyrivibrio sp.]MBQ6589708.1 DUF4422 domain-containing protein [Butyrivibrio sp.]
MEMVIYGAQGIALGAFEAITTIYPEHNIKCFLVTEKGINADTLGGLPVREIASFATGISENEKKELFVLIAVPENVQNQIVSTLEKYGFTNYQGLNQSSFSDCIGNYFALKGDFLPLSHFPVGRNKPEIHVYMTKHEKDKKLTGKYDFPEYMIPIQVGAGMASSKVADMTDDTGDNISFKNGNYSELTGLYWIWKNVLECSKDEFSGKGAYYGLAHYRRVLEISDEDLLRLYDNEIDVVLPYPMPYEPDIHSHHKRYLKDSDYTALKEAVEKVCPEYAKDWDNILGQRYMYNYNIILAKKKVLIDYCRWLFPILKKVEELSVPRGKERSDRYIGYMCETLETVYFMRNRDDFNIAHARCRLFV